MRSVCKYFSGKNINFYVSEEVGFLSSFSLFFIVSLTKSY
ncbi:putative membrane protein [Bacteroides ovatus str. 3725 D9 iii]|nr:putative membrane protein [Bacteroides ovatus str. 3725 D9 iii]